LRTRPKTLRVADRNAPLSALKGRVSWGLLANGASCALPLLMALFVKRYTLPVPYWDEWEWASLLYRMHSGVLRFHDLWEQHNEHRMLFPNLIALALASLGGWNQLRETLFSLFLVVLTQIAIYILLRRIVPRGRLPFAFLAASLLLYSFAQMENWDWGFEIAWFLCNACAVWALLLLGTAGQSWFALLAAMVLATIGSYSSSQGLMIWVGGTFTLLLAEKRRPEQIAAWVVAAAVVYAGYFHGYVKPEFHPDLLFGLHHPLATARYFGAYFGAVFGGWLSFGLAVAMGWFGIGLLVALLAVMVVEYRSVRAVGTRAASFFGLAMYALSVAAITTAGRAGFGELQAEASRYTSIAIYCWLVDFALIFAYADRLSRRLPAVILRLWPAAVVVLVFLYCGSARAALELGDGRLAQVRSAFPALVAGSGPPLTALYPSESAVEEWLRELKSIKDGPYYP
jgi:hypothetical protein